VLAALPKSAHPGVEGVDSTAILGDVGGPPDLSGSNQVGGVGRNVFRQRYGLLTARV
jgi:hypothetical protein